MTVTNYTFEITNIAKETGTMEVRFSAQGLPDVYVGARLPFVGEAVTDVVAQYAPLAYWNSLKQEFQDITPGVTGILAVPPTSQDTAAVAALNAAKAAALKAAENARLPQ